MTFETASYLFGGLGVFLYGMKIMSESLQQAAGQELRRLLGKMTQNRFSAVISGMLATITVQSSSATTVMVVGFVNAGLLTLIEAIGVIMGANIGTTVTAWMVAVLGFKVKIIKFALPAIAVGVAMHFFKRNDKVSIWGNALVGFGLLFLGIKFLKDAVPDAAKSPETFQFLAQFSDLSPVANIFLFIAIGTLLTVVVQSSSAASTITLTLAFTGNISYLQAVAMILGENIGTTVTANLAAIAGNINAKKAALAHTFFNLFGLAWVLILIWPMMEFVDLVIPDDPTVSKESTRFHLSFFHTTFNVLNTVILFGFAGYIARAVHGTFNLFGKGDTDVKPELAYLSAGSVDTTEFAVDELSTYFNDRLESSLGFIPTLGKLTKEKVSNKDFRKISDNEKELDRLQEQVLEFISQVQDKGITGDSVSDLSRIRVRVKALEEIGDISRRFARQVKKARKNKVSISNYQRSILDEQMEMIEAQIKIIRRHKEDPKDAKVIKENQRLRNKCSQLAKGAIPALEKDKSVKKTKLLGAILYHDLARYFSLISNELDNIIRGESH